MKKTISFVLGLFMALCHAAASGADMPSAMKEKMGTLRGTLYVMDKALANAVVSFFEKSGGPPSSIGGARRVPELIARTNAQGEFTVTLLPGTYYMGALIRDESKGAGPPRPGEAFFFIKADQDHHREFTVTARQLHEAGRVNGEPSDATPASKKLLTISGTVTGEDGKPLSGVVVTVKDSMQAPRPRFVSEGTAADGSFAMQVPPGKYYVVARESIQGGKPGIGSYIGSYGKTNPASGEAVPPNAGSQPGASPAAKGLQGSAGGQAILLQGKEGEVLSNINIQMFKIPDPVETREKFEAEAMGYQDKKAAPPAKATP